MPFLIFAILISIVVAMFAIQNAVAVPLNFVFWSFSTSLVIVILGAFLFGILVGAFFMLMMKAKHYLQDKKRNEEINNLHKEVKRMEERIAMLQHTQMLRNEADSKAAAEKTAANSGAAQ